MPIGNINTDLVFAAFAHVNSTCDLDFEFPDQASKLHNIASANVNNTLISLGWGQNDIPMIEQCPKHFATSVWRFVTQYNLRGFDIDYEQPIFSNEDNFIHISKLLRQSLPPPLLLSITTTSLDNIHVPSLNSLFDFINVQSYWSDVHLFIDAGVVPAQITAGVNVESGESFQSAVDQVHQWNLAGLFLWNYARNLTSIITAIKRKL